MEESISLRRFGINPFPLLDKVFQQYPQLPEKVVDIAYDHEADVLYIDFVLDETAVDTEPLDDQGMIIAGLDEQGHIINLTIMNARQLDNS